MKKFRKLYAENKLNLSKLKENNIDLDYLFYGGDLY